MRDASSNAIAVASSGRGGAVDPDQDRRLRGMRHQRIFVVNDRHRAVRVLYDACAHRTEQIAYCTVAATAHHDHVCSLRHVDESGNGGRVVDLGSDFQRAGVPLYRCNDCHRIVNGLVGPLLLPFSDAGRQGRVGQGAENTADDVNEGERLRRVARRRVRPSRRQPSRRLTRRRRPRFPGEQSKTYGTLRPPGHFRRESLVPTQSADRPHRPVGNQDQSTRTHHRSGAERHAVVVRRHLRDRNQHGHQCDPGPRGFLRLSRRRLRRRAGACELARAHASTLAKSQPER